MKNLRAVECKKGVGDVFRMSADRVPIFCEGYIQRLDPSVAEKRKITGENKNPFCLSGKMNQRIGNSL